MSFSNLIRRRVHSVTILRRHGSSTATNRRPQRMLPDEKLCALVSLYHQAETFITLENLSQRIDEAFTRTPQVFMDYASSVKGLKEILEKQRKEAKVTEWDKETAREYDGEAFNIKWSAIKKGREMKVKQALYGLSEGGTLPGIEVLKDAVGSRGNLPKRLENDVRDLLKEK